MMEILKLMGEDGGLGSIRIRYGRKKPRESKLLGERQSYIVEYGEYGEVKVTQRVYKQKGGNR